MISPFPSFPGRFRETGFFLRDFLDFAWYCLWTSRRVRLFRNRRFVLTFCIIRRSLRFLASKSAKTEVQDRSREPKVPSSDPKVPSSDPQGLSGEQNVHSREPQVVSEAKNVASSGKNVASSELRVRKKWHQPAILVKKHAGLACELLAFRAEQPCEGKITAQREKFPVKPGNGLRACAVMPFGKIGNIFW